MRSLKASHPPRSYSGSLAAPRPETGDPALLRAGEAADPRPGCSGSARYAAPAPLRPAGPRNSPKNSETPQAGGKGEPGRTGKRRGCGKAPSFIFPGRAGPFLRGFPLPESDAVWRRRSSASPGPLPPAAPRNRRPERTEPRSAPGITGDEPSGAALRLWCWDFIFCCCCYFFFVFLLLPALIFFKGSGAAGARSPGRCAARGSASPPGTGDRLSPKTAGLRFS